MREPPTHVMLIGHPVITTPLMLGGGVFLLAAWQVGGDAMIPFVAIVAIIGWVGKAAKRRGDYRAWKREWDGMLGEPRISRHAGWWRKPFGVAVALLMMVFLIANTDQAEYSFALKSMGLIATGSIGFFGWRAIRGRRRRRTARTDASLLVAICAKPTTKAPTLDDIFAALPAYCLRLP